MDKREEIKMFVDVSIKYTQSELKECQELLTFLSKNPQIKADAEADEAIEQAHKEATEAKAKQEEGGVSWRNTTGGWTTNECTKEETVTEKAAEEKQVKEYTEKEVIAASADFIKKNSPEVFKGILSQLGARSVSSMPNEKYAELMEAINAK